MYSSPAFSAYTIACVNNDTSLELPERCHSAATERVQEAAQGSGRASQRTREKDTVS